MSTEVGALDTEVHLDYAMWALETGLWDGRPVHWKEANHFLQELEQKVTAYLAGQDPTSPLFDQIGAQLAWLGTHPNSQALLVKDIQALQVTLEGTVVQAGLKKSVSKFWKKHKTEILIGAAILVVVTAVVIIALSTGGAGASTAGAIGGSTIKGLSHLSDQLDSPQKDPHPQIARDISPPSLVDSSSPFQEEGISIDGQFTSYEEILRNPHPDALFCTPYKYQDPLPKMGPAPFPSYNPPPYFPETYTPPPLDFSLPSDLQPMQPPISSTPPPLYDVFTKPRDPFAFPPENPSYKPTFGIDWLDSIFKEKPLVFDVPPRYPQTDFINGINTKPEEALGHIEYLRDLAHQVKKDAPISLQGTYNKTNGFCLDLLEVISLNYWGNSPNTAENLRDKWTRFHEANIDNPNRKYLQFTHSQGNIHTTNALEICPPEIRNRVIVVAIAPATIIPEGYCYRSFHFASKRDVVPYGKLVCTCALNACICALNPCANGGMYHRIEELAKDIGGQLILLEPHPDARDFDHSFQSPTFQEPIKNILLNHIEKDGIYEEVSP